MFLEQKCLDKLSFVCYYGVGRFYHESKVCSGKNIWILKAAKDPALGKTSNRPGCVSKQEDFKFWRNKFSFETVKQFYYLTDDVLLANPEEISPHRVATVSIVYLAL